MKKLTNKVCVILFAVCLILTMALSTVMSFSSGNMMTVLGFATIMIGAFCSSIAARLIGNLDTAKA